MASYTYSGNTSEAGIPQDNYIVALKVDPADPTEVTYLSSAQADEVTGDFTLTWNDWAGRVTIGAIDSSLLDIKDPVFRDQIFGEVVLGPSILETNHPDLLAFYTMSNVSGSTLIDESPNGNNGTLANSPTIVSGRFGGGMLFNGSNQYAQVNNELPSSVTEFSWSFWIEYISGSGLSNYYGQVLGSDVVSFTINASITHAQSREQGGLLYSAQYPTISGLHHVVVNYQKQGYTDVYIDGSLVSSVATNISGAVESSRSTIGAAYVGNYNYYFNGTIEQRRTFNRILTQAEITLLANET